MSLTLLHTSDWHLGATLGDAPRIEEQQRFLDWLVETLLAQRVDVLLVAGDIFHYPQPSAEAQDLYFRFLANVGRDTEVRQVVVIGGNHDSAARIDAPGAVLAALNVHVVGGIGADESTWQRCLIPLKNREGSIEAIVAAIPYVHEYRLGIRTTGRTPAAIASSFHTAFARVYETLAKLAEARWPGIPLVATGHLACGGVSDGDYCTEIHQIGSIGALSPRVFDSRFRYVALGHIHRMFAPEAGRVLYSGTPVALNAEEASSPRYVIRVELGEETSHVPIEVPTWREIRVVNGTLDQVCETLREFEWTSPLPPYVYVGLDVAHHTLGAERAMNDALLGFGDAARPLLVQIRQNRTEGEPGEVAEEEDLPTLGELSPEEVFRQAFRVHRGHEPEEALLVAFRSLLADDREER